ncbi:MAG: TonB-dependent receptor, partial [Terriglobia bacterium]
ALPPGRYRISAIVPGFQHFIANDVNLKVNDQLRIDIALQVGSELQSVNVSAAASQVETESTQLGSVIGTTQMLSMPLNGRNFLDLLPLQTGVAPLTSGTIPNDRPVSGMFTNAGNISVNGQPESGNEFLVNGGEVNETKNMGAGLLPTLDSIQEFRLITNSYNAEYGRFSGGVMNAVTKSGTNGFHGDVFEFLRNNALDARNFFSPTVPVLRQNQFGYAMGGPFWKNKLFWFTDYQGTRVSSGVTQGLIQLPTVAERQGDFNPAAFAGPNRAPATVGGSYWAQVLSQRLGYPVQNGEAYSSPGCATTAACVFPGGVIPSAAFDKVAVNELNYIPAPNFDPSLGLYEDSSAINATRDDKIGQRVDFLNRKTGNWSFYYEFDNSTNFDPIDTQAYSGLPGVPGFSSTAAQRAQMFTVNNTRVFGPTAVNQLLLSFFRTAIHTANPVSGKASLSSLGYTTGLGTLGIVQSGPAGYPEIAPPTSFNNFSFGDNWLNFFQPDTTYMLSDGFSKIAGSHSLKFGGQFSYYQLNARNVCAPNGTFSFNGTETGIDFADFLLGAPTSYVQCTEQFLNNRSRYGALYVQDSWKARPNLTLNPGLRWEVSMPWYDTRGDIEAYVPGEQSVLFPTAPLGQVVPGDPGVPSTLSPTRRHDFAPRFGLAYSPGFTDGVLGKIFGGPGKSSIRGAYGIYYLTQADLGNFGVIGDAPWGLYWASIAPPLLDTPFQSRSTGASQQQRFPFAFPVPGKVDPNFNWALTEPLYEPFYSTQNVLTYAEDYNFSIQRELSPSTLLTIAYVGTQTHHLLSNYNINVGSGPLCQQLNAEGATPQCGPNAEFQTFVLPNGNKVYGSALGAGNQQIGQKIGTVAWAKVTAMWDIGNSNYNALQVTLKRQGRDLTFLVGYTYSKSLDNSNNNLTAALLPISRSLSPFDMTHNFVASYIWDIPFDRAFHSLPTRLTQGWQVSGITRFATGFPVSLSQSGDISESGLGADYPNLVGPVIMQNPHKPGPNGPNTYFLPGAFASETLGVLGNSSPRFFYGPGLVNTDFALEKTIRVTESTSFLLRGEFFNIFNRTNFNTPVGNFSSSQFGEVTSALDPRIGQLSVKFLW